MQSVCMVKIDKRETNSKTAQGHIMGGRGVNSSHESLLISAYQYARGLQAIQMALCQFLSVNYHKEHARCERLLDPAPECNTSGVGHVISDLT